MAALIALPSFLEVPSWEVRVVLETSHGMLVERLVDAGYVVVPVNPDLVARRRGPAKKKDDAEDARIAWHIALDRFERLPPLVPDGEEAAELRAISGDDVGRPSFLRLLQRLPSGKALVSASREELVAFARSSHHGWPERIADQVTAALAADHFVARDYLVRVKSDTIALAATQLLAIGAQRRVWERRMGELLPGAPRHGHSQAPRRANGGRRSLAARST